MYSLKEPDETVNMSVDTYSSAEKTYSSAEKDEALISLMDTLISEIHETVKFDQKLVQVLEKRVTPGRTPGFYSDMVQYGDRMPPKKIKPAKATRPVKPTTKATRSVEPTTKDTRSVKPTTKDITSLNLVQKYTGGSACDNWVLSLAIDSTFILASAAAATGVSVVAIDKITNFMKKFGLDELSIQVIEGLFDVLVESGKSVKVVAEKVINTLSVASQQAFEIGSSAAQHASNVAPLVTDLAQDAGPWVIFGRYVGTNENAIADATSIIKRIREHYVKAKRISTETARAVSSKLDEITQIIEQIKITYTTNVTHVTGIIDTTKQRYAAIKQKVCDSIDSADNAVTDPFGFHEEGINTAPMAGGKGNKSRRKTKRRRFMKNRKSNKHVK